VVVVKEVGLPAAGEVAKVFFARLYNVGAGGVISKALELDTRHGGNSNEKRVTKLRPLAQVPVIYPTTKSCLPLLVQLSHFGYHKRATSNKHHIIGRRRRARGGHCRRYSVVRTTC
jgi:hypothetical protein